MAGNKVYVQGSYVDVHDNEVVNLSIDRAGTVQVQGGVGDGGHDTPGEDCDELMEAREAEGRELPVELASAAAMTYWQQLQESGFVDERFRLQPDTTRKQAMYIADAFSDKLKLKSKWKLFQDFWQINNLAQEKWTMQETGKIPLRAGDIDEIFGS